MQFKIEDYKDIIKPHSPFHWWFFSRLGIRME